MLFAVRYRAAYWLGGLLARIRYTRTRRVEREGHTFYEKRRPGWLAPLIIAGNVYLRISRSGTRVLDRRAWLQRESEMYLLLYDCHVNSDPRGRVEIPALPGQPLAQVLAAKRTSMTEKLDAVRAAAKALSEFHQRPVDAESPAAETQSHGDATVYNVLVETLDKSARWIDFDMAHKHGLPEAWRRADDLRALIYSAAPFFELPEHARLVTTVAEACNDSGTLKCLRATIDFWRWRPTAFHLAQARLDQSQREHLDCELARVLSE